MAASLNVPTSTLPSFHLIFNFVVEMFRFWVFLLLDILIACVGFSRHGISSFMFKKNSRKSYHTLERGALPSMSNHIEQFVESSRKAVGSALVVSGILVSTGPVNAVGLGEHTTCAYPACTTQEEILKANAPGLASTAERDSYYLDLKDMNFILSNAFGAMLDNKDYDSMRSGLRQAPMMNLRLTVRKYAPFLDGPMKKEFMKRYKIMIEGR